MLNVLDKAEAYLRDVGMLQSSGAVLYSGVEKLNPGQIYLLGLNPGGSNGATLKDSLDNSRSGHNAYLDEEWCPGGNWRPKGEATLQRRVQHLCRMMGKDTREVPASNLAFTQSVRIDTHNDFPAAIRASLPVHELFVEAIQPRFLMTFGSLGNFANAVTLDRIESRSAEHGTWQAHRGYATIGGRRLSFGNVPHMSLWASDKREHVLAWVLKSLNSTGHPTGTGNLSE
jgi:hypothetical protein